MTTTSTLKIGVCGASGRMGCAIIDIINRQSETQLAAALVSEGSQFVNLPVAARIPGTPEQLHFTADIEAALEASDVVVDFSNASVTSSIATACINKHVPLLIGTTGFDNQQLMQFDQAAKSIPLLLAPNTSLGVNLCLQLVDMATRALAGKYDIEVMEAHHRNKKDAPSGTAYKFGEVIAKAAGLDLSKHGVFSRYGDNELRQQNDIGFSVIRGGDIIGEHTIMFAGMNERIEITHRAANRENFADGAVYGARWLATKSAGLYQMSDVLSL